MRVKGTRPGWISEVYTCFRGLREASSEHRPQRDEPQCRSGGKRAVVFLPVEATEAQQAQNQVIFLENFFYELRRKAPTGK